MKIWRLKNKKSQDSLAKDMNISRPMIYNYESGFVDFDFVVPEFKMDETDMLNLILVRKNLTVRELAKKLGMSHTHLYKKLKSEPEELLLTIMKKRVYRCK